MHILHKVTVMERTGIVGTIFAWYFNALAQLSHVEILQMISLYLAIIVSLLTIAWYVGNIIMKRKEFFKSISELFKKKKG